jgi:hypothetical protein
MVYICTYSKKYFLLLQKNYTMDLKEILSISGKPGLYKVISQIKNGVIVESLVDKKRLPAYASDKIGNLEEISVYTTEKEKPLKEIFKAIFEKENGGKAIDHKSDDKILKSYFEQVLPEYDKERVYCSDMKKVIAWYNILQSCNMLNFEEEVKENEKVEEPIAEVVTEKKAKTAKSKEPTTEKKEPKEKKIKKTE